MIPIAMLYGTPEDSVAQIAYIEKRGYPISYIEMGEEPDGHYTNPEDYAALYIQWATALHKLDPKLKLGGPHFHRRKQRHRDVGRRRGPNIMDRAIHRLLQVPRPAG